ncbi:MBL fold metallo-hydrolase [Fertoebacter nigrum]|uniref:MBL fold metallo-hydrolase n=2 Tax=Fertoeibacter niger TaxID=2656921 RepID=A0A8X8H7N0_9RHOB|nr:MBL fold metallo-hydrolase [Fertoeibacter niger]NUB44881.1 MBL fold metallo-hydrolase [Fertoeibacter niger]
MPTATLIELDGQRVLVDCGIGCSRALVDAGMDLKDLTTVFITHLHSDHLLELGPLIHTAWCTGLRQPVTIFGPEGIADYWAGFMASMAYDCAIRVMDEGRVPLGDLVRVVVVQEGAIDGAPLAARACRVPHPPLEHCYAFRFDGSRSVTVSGDTAYHPPLAEFAAGSDVLLHEAMLVDGIDLIVQKSDLGPALRAHLLAAHTPVEDAARIARAAGVGQLVLHHLVPVDDARFAPADWLARAAAEWNGPVTLGHDGLEIAL